jgi:hypothetical protein
MGRVKKEKVKEKYSRADIPAYEFLTRRLQTELMRFVGEVLTPNTLGAIEEVTKSTLKHWSRRGNGRVESVAKNIKFDVLRDKNDPSAARIEPGNEYTTWLEKESLLLGGANEQDA